METLSSVGKRIPKRDAIDKVTGRAAYIQDLKVPGMLYGKILRSKYPHARIVRIDTSKAKKLLGVRAVITAEDVPQIRYGFIKDQPVLKSGKVRSYRDELAAVAATDPDIAEEALHLIEVEYEALPGVFDPVEAMKPDAPLIHEENKSNILKHPLEARGRRRGGSQESFGLCGGGSVRGDLGDPLLPWHRGHHCGF